MDSIQGREETFISARLIPIELKGEDTMSMSVLIIDDSAAMRKTVKRALEMAELPITTCHQASNGYEGLEILKNQTVDVAFVDLAMPIMDGVEFIKQVRNHETWHKLPIAVISSISSEDQIQELEEQGVIFIGKPFSAEDIYEKCKHLEVL